MRLNHRVAARIGLEAESLAAGQLDGAEELRGFLCPEPDPRERTAIWTWSALVALRSGINIRPVGAIWELAGEDLSELQARTHDAFVRPVFRVRLDAALLALRFYGDLCRRIDRHYASLSTVARTPGFGEYPRNLLGLTGRNSGNNLVAVRIAAGSQIVIGGISNRAKWADQILIEGDNGVTVVDNFARYLLPA